jgi:hypothetical protein
MVGNMTFDSFNMILEDDPKPVLAREEGWGAAWRR